MQDDPIIFTIFLIFSGAAVAATLALYARQALIIAYIGLGVLFGPSMLGWVNDPQLIQEIANIGIMFLLFIMGLNLQPQELLGMVRKTTLVTAASSLVFSAIGGAVAWLAGYSALESLLVGTAMMFSSTIIGLKLMPTRVLHHQRTGEVIISILLLQDLIAVIVLLLLEGGMETERSIPQMGLFLLALPMLIAISALLARMVLIPLITRFDTIHEYIFLMVIGWCLGIAELATVFGLSHEIGAFIGGVTLAANPIALYVADGLKNLRDFFLIMFFFSLGASFELGLLQRALIPALILAALTIIIKPSVFRWLLVRSGESSKRSNEIGFRLGQLSEFSLLIAVLAYEQHVISAEASYLIQLATLFTFLVSSYIVVMRFPTPIAVSDRLRQD